MNAPLAPSPALHLAVDSRRYLNLARPPESLLPSLDILVDSRACLPDTEDLRKDWVASVAVPAFKLIRQYQGDQAAFCALGTGVGLDALAAVETLGSTRIGITDVHETVVSAAYRNILSNLRHPTRVIVEGGHGDLLAPLAPYGARYDLIYENLPNVPIGDPARLEEGRTSTAHLPPRPEPVPALVGEHLLSLHYLALVQARDFLKPGGAVLSMLGSRIPLAVYGEMARLAGYRADIYTYGWKVQVEGEAVIPGHAAQQAAGYGPFHFYRAADLEQAFAGVALESSGQQAEAIEARLAPKRLDPFQAWAAYQGGEAIGHTYVALRSRPL